MFDQRVPITEDIMLQWRLLVEEGRKTGYTFSQPDLIIAATAIHHGHTVVTRVIEATMTKRECPSSIPGIRRKVRTTAARSETTPRNERFKETGMSSTGDHFAP